MNKKSLSNYFLSRVGNYGFWLSLASFIPLALQLFGDVNILPENYQEIVNTILGLLVALGICNNPTTKAKFYSDDKE